METLLTSSLRKQLAWLCAAFGIPLLTAGASAGEALLDCPLRDSPYSVDLPLMDLLQSTEAVAVASEEMPTLMGMIPPMFKETSAPSLSSIMTLRGVTRMLRMPEDREALQRLDDRLAQVVVDEDARRARCARYDNDSPNLALSDARYQLLVFDKINGFDHGPAVAAATAAIEQIAVDLGWGVTVTDKGGAFKPEILARFDAVIFNNNSGDVLTLSQRRALETYIEQGGGALALHGAGGDFEYFWEWYVNDLIGAQFIGHTMGPHFQDARVTLEESASGIGANLERSWTIHDEWYSFARSPRLDGADVVATIDENSYKPEMGGLSLRMGEDHPVAWARCIENGRSFYSAIGHHPEVYQSEEYLLLLRDALKWAAGDGQAECRQ